MPHNQCLAIPTPTDQGEVSLSQAAPQELVLITPPFGRVPSSPKAGVRARKPTPLVPHSGFN